MHGSLGPTTAILTGLEIGYISVSKSACIRYHIDLHRAGEVNTVFKDMFVSGEAVIAINSFCRASDVDTHVLNTVSNITKDQNMRGHARER